jgi:hypothetical protein
LGDFGDGPPHPYAVAAYMVTSREGMPRRKSALRFVATASFLVACSGPGLRGDVYRGDGLAFRLGEVPSSWRRLSVSNVRLAFRDEASEASVLVNAHCGRDGEDVPLLALTKHLFMSFTDKEMVEQKIIPMDGREAMHTLLSAKLDGVPKTFDAFVLKKDGCIYDFVCISAPSQFEKNRPAFEQFVAGFRTLSETP